MYRIKSEHSHTIEIEKSRFITYLKKVFSEEEAKTYLNQIQKSHPNANHHCYAFLIGEHNEIQRSNDNGEPSGTAGVPMLESLRKHHMQDTIAISVRYFGGIKLGAGGLIRAYSHSVSEALKSATLTQTLKVQRYSLQFSYDLIGKIDYYFSKNEIAILEKQYEENVTYIFHSTTDDFEFFQEISNGQFVPKFIKDEIIEQEIACPF